MIPWLTRALLLLGIAGILHDQVLAQADTIETTVPHLKQVFARDFSIGCLLSYRHVGFPDDPPVPGQSAVIAPNGGKLIQYHMNCMSPGNNMKPLYTVDIAASASAYAAAGSQAAKDSVDTHPVIRFNADLIAQLNWAQRQGFTFRGHTLVWHNQTPAELFRAGYTTGGARLTKERMTQRLENYIAGVIRLLHASWPGLLSAMDVVNEAVTDAGADRTTDSEWYATFGDNSYIMKAFELTRKQCLLSGETQMKLYYNDYNTSIAAKANGIVRVCGPIYRAGYLDGIGMQEHDAIASPTADAWIASYVKFDTVCAEMSVTELDVATGSATPSAALLATQANQYGQLFKCFVERSFRSGRGKIVNVSKDGLNDQYTFVTNQSTSLWDAKNKCKPAFFAVVGVGRNYNALDSLIRYAESLQQASYTPASWAQLSSALASGRGARDRNYTSTLSADTLLGAAQATLRSALSGLTLTGVAGQELQAATFTLSQNYPNPFNPPTVIRYQVPASGPVSLRVYDLLGREVAVLVNELQAAGSHAVTFSPSRSGGQGLSSGLYVYRLIAGGHAESRTMAYMK